MLTVQNLKYQYGSQIVLPDMTFALESGQIAVLIGRNGAGKSTLLRCLAGWAVPEAGSVTINGYHSTEHEREFRKQVIFVPDTPEFYDELSAWEHLQFISELHRIEGWEEAADDLLERYGLDPFEDALPTTFSRGMRYKMALVMALLVKPPVLLLDEPFAPLDADARDQLWQSLLTFRDNGHLVVLSAHALPEGAAPDQVLLLRDGQLARVEKSSTFTEMLNYVE